jgi:hypothetical protein
MKQISIESLRVYLGIRIDQILIYALMHCLKLQEFKH